MRAGDVIRKIKLSRDFDLLLWIVYVRTTCYRSVIYHL